MNSRKKYRRTSMRMPLWDYAGNGRYFITFVTKNRICNLSKIVNEKVILSDFGKIVEEEWLKSFKIRKELTCDIYVIMPNHIHATVILKKPLDDNSSSSMESPESSMRSHGRAILPGLYRKPKSISSFIAGFKSSVNTKIDNYIDEHRLEIPKYNKKESLFSIQFS